MTNTARTMLLVVGALALTAASAAAQTAPATDAPPEEADSPHHKLGVSSHVESVFTSNLFHEQDRRVDDFDSKNDPGERYDGMEGPSDLVTEVGLEAAWKRRAGKRRELKLAVMADYLIHLRNPIANHAVLGAEARADVTRRDRIELAGELIPDRFDKNRASALDAAGDKIFSAAYMLEAGVDLSYLHRWTKRFHAGPGYELDLKRYDDPFANRDEDRHTLELLGELRASRRLALELGLGVSRAFAPGGMELGVVVDRSYDSAQTEVAADWQATRRWSLELGGSARLKTYSTDVAADDTYFERQDLKLGAEAAVGCRLGDAWRLLGLASFTRNLSDRSDPTLDPTDVGYQEAMVGLGLEVDVVSSRWK